MSYSAGIGINLFLMHVFVDTGIIPLCLVANQFVWFFFCCFLDGETQISLGMCVSLVVLVFFGFSVGFDFHSACNHPRLILNFQCVYLLLLAIPEKKTSECDSVFRLPLNKPHDHQAMLDVVAVWVLSSPNVLSPQFSAKSLPFAFGTKVLTLCGDFLLLYGVSWFVMILHAMHLMTHPKL